MAKLKSPSNKLHDRQRWVYHLLKQREHSKILEVGCATGYLSGILRTLTKQLVSLDINPEAVREAKRNTKGVHFYVCPAEKLSFKTTGFDVVVFLDVLEHTLDPAKAIEQIGKKMKKEGRLYLSVPQKGLFEFLDVDNLKRAALKHFPSLYSSLYKLLAGKELGQMAIPPKHRHYSLNDIRALLGNGFEIEESYHKGLLMYPLGLILDPFVKRIPLIGKAGHWFLNGLMDLDFRMSYGPASYNLLVVAVKT